MNKIYLNNGLFMKGISLIISYVPNKLKKDEFKVNKLASLKTVK